MLTPVIQDLESRLTPIIQDLVNTLRLRREAQTVEIAKDKTTPDTCPGDAPTNTITPGNHKKSVTSTGISPHMLEGFTNINFATHNI